MKIRWKIVLIASLIGNLIIIYVAYKAIEYRAHINEFRDKYVFVVDELSRRDVFGEANQALRSDTMVTNRIVFFGTQTVESWPLERYFSDYETINRGVFGQRVAGMVLRFIPDVIDLSPEYVVIEISSYNFRPENDIAEIQDYLKTMLQLARTNGIRPVACTIIPPCRDSIVNKDYDYYDFEEYDLMDSLAVFNRWLTDYCAGNNYRLADVNSVLSDDAGYLKTEYASGPIDLNDEGYEIVSREVQRVIE